MKMSCVEGALRDLKTVIIDVYHFDPESISVLADSQVVVIKGSHSEQLDEHGYVSRSFHRIYQLPEDLKPGNISVLINPARFMLIRVLDESKGTKTRHGKSEVKNRIKYISPDNMAILNDNTTVELYTSVMERLSKANSAFTKRFFSEMNQIKGNQSCPYIDLQKTTGTTQESPENSSEFYSEKPEETIRRNHKYCFSTESGGKSSELHYSLKSLTSRDVYSDLSSIPSTSRISDLDYSSVPSTSRAPDRHFPSIPSTSTYNEPQPPSDPGTITQWEFSAQIRERKRAGQQSPPPQEVPVYKRPREEDEEEE